MSRFADPQDPRFRAINTSIGFDYRLAPHDLDGSLAHARMLARVGILTDDELADIERGLAEVRAEIENGSFEIKEDDEDIHMAVERRLTEIVGPVGGKLHTARSRNDQVATDVALFVHERAHVARKMICELMGLLARRAEEHLDWSMPGYTHLQRAQPVYLSH
jgi:argininosuccinate lyase